MKRFMSVWLRLLASFFLICLAVIYLLTVIRAIPDGVTIYVNQVWGMWEIIGDIVCLVAAIVCGILLFIFTMFVEK